MPIEGSLPEATPDTPATPATPNAQTSPDAGVNNTGAPGTPTAGTDNAQNGQAQTEKTFTQADVDRMIANRVKSGIKAELKKMTGETDGTITVESLQQQLNEERTARQGLEARQSVREFLTDASNQLNVNPVNLTAIEELVHARITFENGKPSNLKDAIATVKNLAPTLFANTPAHVNAGEGRKPLSGPVDMNEFIRRAAGHGR